MTPEEIAASDDVDELYTHLRAAKAFDDHVTVRAIEARMRELSGANTRADGRGGRVAVDGAEVARVEAQSKVRGTGNA